MDILDILAEQKIAEANAEGKLDDLPGKGKPLKLDEDSPLVPREQRAMMRLMKQFRVIPGWIQQAKDLVTLDTEIGALEATLYRAHESWSEELVLFPTPERFAAARKWFAESRARFVELVQRRAQLFRAYDAAAPRTADRSMARNAEDTIRRFDKLFPQL